MIMRFRPANISLINRRHYLPRLLLTLSSIEKNDQRTLTGHYISMYVSPVILTFRALVKLWEYGQLKAHQNSRP